MLVRIDCYFDVCWVLWLQVVCVVDSIGVFVSVGFGSTGFVLGIMLRVVAVVLVWQVCFDVFVSLWDCTVLVIAYRWILLVLVGGLTCLLFVLLICALVWFWFVGVFNLLIFNFDLLGLVFCVVLLRFVFDVTGCLLLIGYVAANLLCLEGGCCAGF